MSPTAHKHIFQYINAKTVRDENNCWIWNGYKTSFGYGIAYWKGKTWRAHRLSFFDFYNYLTPGLVIDHTCRNRRCVNPTHLEEVTQQDNVLRGVGIAAKRSKQTECVQGHLFDTKNTFYIFRNGKMYRQCKECKANYQRRYREKNGYIRTCSYSSAQA